MTQLQNLQVLVGDAEFSANLSPAESLDLIVGYDADGWDDRLTFTVGDVVVSPADTTHKVIGFTIADTIIAVPVGLGHNSAIRHIEFEAMGWRLDHVAPQSTIDWLNV